MKEGGGLEETHQSFPFKFKSVVGIPFSSIKQKVFDFLIPASPKAVGSPFSQKPPISTSPKFVTCPAEKVSHMAAEKMGN